MLARPAHTRSPRGKNVVLGLAVVVLSAIGAGSIFLSPISAQSCGYGGYGGGCTGEPATIVLSPRSATNGVGTQHCVTATVRDAVGAAVGGVNVRFSVVGTGESALQATGTDGKTVFCYSNSAGPRTDTISATVETVVATGPYLENPASCPPGGLGFPFAFHYQNGESLSMTPTIACSGAGATASATSPSGQTQSVNIARTSGSGPTSLNISTSLSKAGGPPAPKASPHTGIDIGLPAGMVRNFNNFPTCIKADLARLGPRACPAGSRIGSGGATFDARPIIDQLITGTVSAYNGPAGTVLLWIVPEISSPLIAEGVPNAGGTLVFAVPRIVTLPGQPDATMSTLAFTLGATGAGGASPSDSVTNTWTAASTTSATTTTTTPTPRPLPPGAAPRVNLAGPTTQQFTGSLAVSATCAQACNVSASARVSVPGASKVFKSKRLSRNLAAGQRVTLKLTFPKKAAKAIRRALRRKRLTANVSVTTRGVGANASSAATVKRKIKLRR